MPLKDPEARRLYDRQRSRNPKRRKQNALRYHADIEKGREKNRTSYAKHQDARRAYAANYREEHKDEIAVKKAEYAKEHREQTNAYFRDWYHRNREKIRAALRAKRLAQQDVANERRRAYYTTHIDVAREGQRRRRARKKHAPLNDVSAAQWLEIQTAYHFRCAYCGKKPKALTQDHITPLSKGGSHTATNIVPACKNCNSQKNTGPPPVPVQPFLLTLAPPKKNKGS